MAVARDNSFAPFATASGTTSTKEDFVNAGNVITVFVYEEASDSMVGVTWNTSENFTFGAKTHLCYSSGENTHTLSVWYLVGATATTADIVATRSTSTSTIDMGGISFTGAGTPDATSGFITGTPGSCGAGATLLSGNLTTLTDNSWIAGFARFDNGGTPSGSGSYTKLEQGSGGAAIEATFDTNGALTPAGSKTIGLTGAGAGSVIGFINIAVPPTPPSSVKTVDGIAFADVKTWNGVATGNIA